MTDKQKKEFLEEIEYELTFIKDQELLYRIFRQLAHGIPNNMELGEAIRLLFISNIK